MRRAILVTGTDTGVGKTFVACGLARALRAAGRDVGAMKPFACGAIRKGKRTTHEDIEALIEATGAKDPFKLVCPCLFRDPLAPMVAAEREGRKVDIRAAAKAVAAMSRRHEILLVEGAGGLLVPLRRRATIADFAKALGLPLLIVTRPSLGTLNHTRLTVEAAESRGLRVLGLIVNHLLGSKTSLAEKTNLFVLEEFAGAPVVGVVPRGGGKSAFRKIAKRLGLI